MHQSGPPNTDQSILYTTERASIQTDIARKKTLFRHVCHERSMLIKKYRTRGRVTKYNAVIYDNSLRINENTTSLLKLCTHYNDMSMVPHGRGKFILYGNNNALLTITKQRNKRVTDSGSGWLIEKYANGDLKSTVKFQHGFVFVLRVPMLPVRLGVFFKAPIYQDFFNFNDHFRKQDSYNIMDYSLNFPTVTEPAYGYKYYKLSNTFDLTRVFNDVHLNDSVKELSICSASKKNFTLHCMHQLYDDPCDDPTHADGRASADSNTSTAEMTLASADTSSANGVASADTCTDSSGVNVSVDTFTDTFYKPPSPDRITNTPSKYISMNRHEKDFYFTTFTAPMTPAIAFITSVLACNDK